MDDNPKVYYPEEISENPYPSEIAEVSLTTTTPKEDNVSQSETTKSRGFPERKVAHELIASALNTRSRRIIQEFQFTKSGSIQIGEYDNGVSGDIRITPNGITARDSAGLTTFDLDGTTGDAVFKGSVQAGSVITGIVSVGDNNIVIDGDARRMVFYDENDVPVILIGNA